MAVQVERLAASYALVLGVEPATWIGVNRVGKSADEEAHGPGSGDADRAPFTPRGYYGGPGNPWLPTGPAVPLGKPRPGHGTVYVSEDRDGIWDGVWDDGYPPEQIEEGGPIAGSEDFEGSREEVLRWARSRPAAKFLIFSRTTNDYVPLPRDEG